MKRSHLHIFVLVFCLAGYGWIAWNESAGPALHSTPTLCLFKQITGVPCPSCGATRSLELLLAGDPAGSIGENPVGILLGLALIVSPVWIILDTIRRRESFYRFYGATDRVFSAHRMLAVAGAALIAANWYWNILKGL
ncbi:MAG TPA: DUF2752 domain-containing protein [Bacteroidota bacterium]|nr:DUF2752 domain-containing protein [Bacteroidota bacterium]